MALQTAILALNECPDRETFQRAVPEILLKLSPHYDEQDEWLFRLIRPHYEQVCRRIQQAEAVSKADCRRPGEHGLTARETEVARWLMFGKSNSEIARILGGSVRTVEKHLEAILNKLKVENRTAAALVLTARPPAPANV
jgi:DNA-binding CsgD family transcriptional regulator